MLYFIFLKIARLLQIIKCIGVILQGLGANFSKLRSKIRMKIAVPQHDNVQSTYRQQNKELIEDTHVRNFS